MADCLSCFKYGFTCHGGSFKDPCDKFQPLGQDNPVCKECWSVFSCSGIVHNPECRKREANQESVLPK